MAKYKPQQRRLIFIDHRIRTATRFEGNYPNATTLGEQLEVNPKTIRRDIEYMRVEMDAPIEYDSEHHGYRYTENNWRMPAVLMKETDLYAVCIAEEVLKQYSGTPVYENMFSMLEKLLSALPQDLEMDPVWINERFTFLPQPAPVVDKNIWVTVFKALRSERTIEFDYKLPSHSRAYRRTVNPYHAISHRGQWYLVGYCHYMKELRVFSMSRMSNTKNTTNGYRIPQDFDFEEYAGKHFGVIFGDEEHDVQIEFNPIVAPYAREQQWHKTQKVEELEDGSVVISFQANHLLEVRRWVLSWGAGARVLSPPELIEQVRDELRTGLEHYSKP